MKNDGVVENDYQDFLQFLKKKKPRGRKPKLVVKPQKRKIKKAKA